MKFLRKLIYFGTFRTDNGFRITKFDLALGDKYAGVAVKACILCSQNRLPLMMDIPSLKLALPPRENSLLPLYTANSSSGTSSSGNTNGGGAGTRQAPQFGASALLPGAGSAASALLAATDRHIERVSKNIRNWAYRIREGAGSGDYRKIIGRIIF